MYNERGSLSAEGAAWLAEREAELGRPIRWIYGRCRVWRHQAWTEEQAEACGNATLADCEERGITIVGNASLHNIQFGPAIRVPEVLAFDDDYINFELYDTIAVPDRMPLAEPLTIEGLNFGEIGDRVITLAGEWGGWMNRNVMDIGVLLDAALIRCIDEQFIEGLREARETLARDQFLDYVENTGEQGITAIRNEVDAWAVKLARDTSRVAEAKIKLREQQRILDAVLQTAEDGTTRAHRLEQWQMLNDDERVERIDFNPDSNTVIIETTGANLTHPVDGRTVYLGKFSWTVNIGSGEVFVTNLDNQRGGFDHPHVFQGRPCFGDMGETIATFIMQGRLHPAVDMIWLFLGNVQLRDDYGRRAAFWFEQPDVTDEAPAELATA